MGGHEATHLVIFIITIIILCCSCFLISDVAYLVLLMLTWFPICIHIITRAVERLIYLIALIATNYVNRALTR